MRDTLFIGGLCLVILLVGAGLYFFEPERSGAERAGNVRYELLAEGQHALEIDMEKNYQIRSDEELTYIWSLIHGDERPSVPRVDFARHEVLAMFDGSHTTSGFSIAVAEITDTALTRTVHIEHRRPAENCQVTSMRTSPYLLVAVPKMRESLRLTHSDAYVTIPCP